MQNKSIIIVEDDNIIAFELQSRLEDNGFRVLGPYAYGEDLIKEFDRLKADLILMDIHLKGQLDGIQTAEKIKLLGKIPIIYLTAYADQETLDRAKITEPFGYIIKPFEERELFTNIQIALYRNEMESKLIESEKIYRNIYDNAIEGMYRTTLDGKFLQVNKSMARILGYDNTEEVISEIHDIGTQIWLNLEDRFNYLDKLNYEGIVNNLEYKFKNKKGNIIWLSINSKLVKDANGNVVFIEGYLQDVTEKIEIERKAKETDIRFQSLIKNAIEGILIAQGTNLKFVNKSIIQITGYNEEELLTIPFIEFIHPDFRELMKDNYIKRIKGEPIPSNYEIKIITKDRSVKWLEMVGERIEWENAYAIMMFVSDISERKKSESILIESERKYRALLENANIGIIVIQGPNLKFVNKNIISLTGYSLVEALSTPFSDYIHPDYKEMAMDFYFKRMNRETVPSSYNIQIIAKDKSFIWVEVNGEIVEWENEPAVMHFIKDISARKNSEESLLKLNSAIQNLKEVVFITDKDGVITFINKEFTNLYGYTAEEVIGKVTPRILKSSLSSKESIDYLWNMLLSNQRMFGEYVNKTKDGKLIQIEGSAESILNDKGQIIGFIGIQRDIGERIRNEKMFQDIIDYNPMSIQILDLEGHTIQTNFAFNNLFKAIPPKEYSIFKDEQLIKQGLGELFDRIIKGEVVSFPDSQFNPHFVNPFFPDITSWIKVIGFTLNDKNGNPEKVVLIHENITQRKIAEEEIEKQNKEIESQYEEYMQLNEVLRQTNYHLEKALSSSEESDRLKTAFLHNISHEIRTPLNEIIGLSNILSKEYLNEEEISEIINDMKSSSYRLIETISNVIDISMIETEQLEPPFLNFSLNSVISDLATFFSGDIKKKNLKLILKDDKDSEIELISNEKLLFQILSNLIANAIKFTHSGFIEVGYETKYNEIQFYVKDSGIGISEEHQSSIFRVFEQVDSSLSRGYEGIGLGLPICKGLVKLLGGKIWFESNPNEGSTFYFTIPYKNDKAKVDTATDINEHQNNKNLIKVLVVEDHWSSFQYLNKLLTYNQFTIIHAENGRRAIDFVSKIDDIDLVLMDINMPIMDGYEATTKIKQIRPDLPIIAQTVCSLEEEIENIYHVGCDEYISKPINADILYSLINKYKK